jgi:cellobiose phosphorylase
VRIEADKLRFVPCLPADWKGFKVRYRYRETVYTIAVLQSGGAGKEMSVTVDGVAQHDAAIALVDDRQEHAVEVRIHEASA